MSVLVARANGAVDTIGSRGPLVVDTGWWLRIATSARLPTCLTIPRRVLSTSLAPASSRNIISSMPRNLDEFVQDMTLLKPLPAAICPVAGAGHTPRR